MTALGLGECHREDPRAYLQELDQFRGAARLGVVFAHALPGEQRLSVDYLTTIGRVLDSLLVPGGTPLNDEPTAAVYLMDLSDRRLLDITTAERFPVPDPATSTSG